MNSSSPGADAVEEDDISRLIEGRRLVLRGLAKRGDELRMGCLPAAMDEVGECRERRVYEPSSEDRSREDRERLGPGWKESESARDPTGAASAGSGSWKRTVRLGLVIDVDEDLIEVWPEERMEAWSVLA